MFRVLKCIYKLRNETKPNSILMFAPKRGHVTHCVTRDGLTFVPFLSSCCNTLSSFS